MFYFLLLLSISVPPDGHGAEILAPVTNCRSCPKATSVSGRSPFIHLAPLPFRRPAAARLPIGRQRRRLLVAGCRWRAQILVKQFRLLVRAAPFARRQHFQDEDLAIEGNGQDVSNRNLPAGLIEDAQNAFISGFNGAAIFSAISVTILAILAAVMLRHVEPLGPSDEGH